MMDNLETQIASVLDRIVEKDREEGGLSTTQWTQLIKEGLCTLGKSFNYGVSASGCKEKGADTGEWVFDLMWADGDNEKFIEMPLVMECEWSPDIDQIFWDFQKLLIAKSQHKLFIYQQDSDSEVQRVAKQLSSAIQEFRTKLPQERYMLAGWSGDKESFIYDVI